MWGKRDDDEKRKWGQKTSRVWGKRMDDLVRLLQDDVILPNERAAELQDKTYQCGAGGWGRRRGEMRYM